MELLLLNGHTFHLIAAAFICLFRVTVFHNLVKEENSREPPLVPQKIPQFGHGIVFLVHGLGYFNIIRFASLSFRALTVAHTL
jgi:hypothetical protein